MELSYYACMIVIIWMASVIQSAVGFAYALFATPLLIWLGTPLPRAIAIVAMCSFLQASIGSRQLRASVPWRFAISAITIRIVGTVLGISLLKQLAIQSRSDIKLVVGCILCVLVIFQLVCRIQPRDAVHWLWGGLAFSASGVLTGVCGMGGPPMVLWSLAHKWSVEKTRGFLFVVAAASIPFQIFLLYISFGVDILRGILIALLAAPAVFLGAKIGMPIGNQMSKNVLNRIVYLILLVVGISSVAPSILQYLWS